MCLCCNFVSVRPIARVPNPNPVKVLRSDRYKLFGFFFQSYKAIFTTHVDGNHKSQTWGAKTHYQCDRYQ